MSAIGGVTSGVEQFLKNNSMDIKDREQASQTSKTEGATSTDFESAAVAAADREREPSNELTFEDMLSLMLTQLQNQTIDNTADTNDMMNQLISMTVMQSLTTLTTAVEEVQTASVMNYASSLVGKEVTLGIYNEKTKKVEELYGIVEASGTYDGKQVIFVDGESYFLSSIMAVGKLPPMEEEPGVDGSGDADENNGENTDVENSGAAAGAAGGGSNEDGSAGGTDAGSGVSGAGEAAQV